MVAPEAHTVTVFPPGPTPARYFPSGDTAAMDSGGRVRGWAGSTAAGLACTMDVQPWFCMTAPVRLKAGMTAPTAPAVTWVSQAHRNQACSLAT